MKNIVNTVIIFLLFLTVVHADKGFYVKLTKQQAKPLIGKGIMALFGKTPTKFKNYTYFIEDFDTGDRYYKVENVQYSGIKYNVVDFLENELPGITKYTHGQIKQFIPGLEINGNITYKGNTYTPLAFVATYGKQVKDYSQTDDK